MSEEGKKTEISWRFHSEEENVLEVKYSPLNPVKVLTFVMLCMLRVQMLIEEGKQHYTRFIWNLLLFWFKHVINVD